MNKILTMLIFTLSALLFVNRANSQGYDGKHEWRAVWIATVNNIDWPSKPGLSSQEQQQELIDYLDLFKSMNFNAVILQIRPTADAFYKSKLEPWSIYLTGDQSVAPQPLYDPLEFAIKEAHKRGMELHAWLNPYRVSQDTSNLKDMAQNHIYRKRPDLFVRHGKKLYFDPAFPETREFLVEVIKDLVVRYDLDGIHFDDYFYPNNDFVDDYSFSLHSRGYSIEDKMAWRRENVDLVIEMLRDSIKAIKPLMKYGISPYAVWRNKREDPRGSQTKSYGYTNYDHLHADLLLWMEKGWLDYVLPQLYFNIGYEAADFKILAEWWQNYSAGTPLYGGLGTYRLERDAKIPEWRSADQIKQQAEMLRTMTSYQGACYFNAKNFKENRLEINSIMRELYPNPALVPTLRGFPKDAPDSPKQVSLTVGANGSVITWKEKDMENQLKSAKYHALYRFPKGSKPDFKNGKHLFCITGENSIQIEAKEDVSKYDYYVSALNRLFNESEATRVKIRNNK